VERGARGAPRGQRRHARSSFDLMKIHLKLFDQPFRVKSLRFEPSIPEVCRAFLDEERGERAKTTM
jgi:hypothetical protein